MFAVMAAAAASFVGQAGTGRPSLPLLDWVLPDHRWTMLRLGCWASIYIYEPKSIARDARTTRIDMTEISNVIQKSQLLSRLAKVSVTLVRQVIHLFLQTIHWLPYRCQCEHLNMERVHLTDSRLEHISSCAMLGVFNSGKPWAYRPIFRQHRRQHLRIVACLTLFSASGTCLGSDSGVWSWLYWAFRLAWH